MKIRLNFILLPLLFSCSESAWENRYHRISNFFHRHKLSSIDTKRQTLLGDWVSQNGEQYYRFQKKKVFHIQNNKLTLYDYLYVDHIDTVKLILIGEKSIKNLTYFREYSHQIFLQDSLGRLGFIRIYKETGILVRSKEVLASLLSTLYPPCENLHPPGHFGFWSGLFHGFTIGVNYGTTANGFESGTYCFGNGSFFYLFGYIIGFFSIALIFFVLKELWKGIS